MSSPPDTSLNSKQPPPVANTDPAVWDLVFADLQRSGQAESSLWKLVIRDMQDRDRMGLRKHGTRLQPGNGRDALVDAYQEALDLVAYLRQAVFEHGNASEINAVASSYAAALDVVAQLRQLILERNPSHGGEICR